MILLNSQQQEALIKLDIFIQSRQEKVFLLEGFAGTGKTTVITQLFGSRKFFKKDIVFAATTNKAVSVLQEMFKLDYEHIDFKTIHKLCKIKRNISSDGEINFNLNESPEHFMKKQKTIFSYDIIVIDECSMISSKILTLLVNYSNKIKGKIIFVGDRYQLPPVNEEISEVFQLPMTTYCLSKIVRCKDSVVEFASRIRESIDQCGNISTKGCKSENFITFKQDKPWLEKYISEFDSNMNNVLLAYTNSRCNDINKYIRKKIYGDIASTEFVENEVIIFNNFYKSTPVDLVLDTEIASQDDIPVYKINPIEVTKHENDNAPIFYTSHKAIISTISKIKLTIPSFPLEALFNLTKKLDVNFKSVKPDDFDPELNCPICFDKIKDKESIETDCHHIFCHSCIKQWTEKNKQCPYCRMALAEERITIKDDPGLGELINKFKQLTNDLSFTVWKIEVNSPTMRGTIYTPIREDKPLLSCKINQIKTAIHDIKKHITNNIEKNKYTVKQTYVVTRLWEYFYYNFVDLFADISYGYCITVHKSQGSTFDDVFIESKNILKYKNKDTLNCLYTAVTRSSKRVCLLI